MDFLDKKQILLDMYSVDVLIDVLGVSAEDLLDAFPDRVAEIDLDVEPDDEYGYVVDDDMSDLD